MKKTNVVIFGVTGSIGSSTISILSNNSKSINIEGITCNTNVRKLIKIAKTHNVKKIGFNEKSVKNFRRLHLNNYKVFNDLSDFHNIISDKTDVIIFAISGLSCLDLLLKLLKTGKKIGIANKECIITLGNKFKKQSKKYNTQIIPLDSEHNSIYHLLKKDLGKYKSITITATGGPFLKFNRKELMKVTPSQAMRHPVWNMGKKISIDSATMMNKALELIEAKYLFDLEESEINTVIHPQAIIHALINYENGTSTAILNKPDMQIPIASLFFQFNKFSRVNYNLDLSSYMNLELIPLDKKKYPAIELSYLVMKMGGLAPHVLNYTNELLVNYFIMKKIKFTDIVELNKINLERIFAKNSNITEPKLIDINNINNWIDNNIFIGK